MTWRELKKQLGYLTDEQLDTDVTIYHPADTEFYPAIETLKINKNFDVLDEDHPFIVTAS